LKYQTFKWKYSNAHSTLGFDGGLSGLADQPKRTIMRAKVAKNARVKRTLNALWLEA
jgi:hypothetical protein